MPLEIQVRVSGSQLVKDEIGAEVRAGHASFSNVSTQKPFNAAHRMG